MLVHRLLLVLHRPLLVLHRLLLVLHRLLLLLRRLPMTHILPPSLSSPIRLKPLQTLLHHTLKASPRLDELLIQPFQLGHFRRVPIDEPDNLRPDAERLLIELLQLLVIAQVRFARIDLAELIDEHVDSSRRAEDARLELCIALDVRRRRIRENLDVVHGKDPRFATQLAAPPVLIDAV